MGRHKLILTKVIMTKIEGWREADLLARPALQKALNQIDNSFNTASPSPDYARVLQRLIFLLSNELQRVEKACRPKRISARMWKHLNKGTELEVQNGQE